MSLGLKARRTELRRALKWRKLVTAGAIGGEIKKTRSLLVLRALLAEIIAAGMITAVVTTIAAKVDEVEAVVAEDGAVKVADEVVRAVAKEAVVAKAAVVAVKEVHEVRAAAGDLQVAVKAAKAQDKKLAAKTLLTTTQ